LTQPVQPPTFSAPRIDTFPPARPSTAQAPAPVDVIIVNYNTRDDLRACLTTVLAAQPAQVIVVDNASTDGSPAMVHAEFPTASLIAYSGNPGYGAAANRGISAGNAPYALLLNSDTQVPRGALRPLAAYLDAHPRAAIAGPRLRNLDGSLQPSCFPFPTPLHTFLRENTLGRLVGHFPLLRDRYLPAWAHDQARDVPWVLGAALAIRRQAFGAIGGFDESFFMYFEEVDLCYRLRAAGWQIHFAPVADVMHTGGRSTRHYRTGMAIQLYDSLRHFYRQHYSAVQARSLEIVIAYIMLRNAMRDAFRLHRTRDVAERKLLSEDLKAWRSVLSHRTK
jgi:N-acetylglucosaminyl-diphospho-decaprenol L-rhamnosyltransferase